MDIIGLDLHKRESQLCIRDEDGTITESRIVTSRERFTVVLGNRPRAKILLEASTESEWVARHLESLGHEVLVADPNYAPMYATRSRRTKTDRRDARTLMDACQTGAYRLAHRLSDPRRHVRAELAVRDALVRTRTRYVALAKTLVRRDGLRVASSESHLVAQRIGALSLSPVLAAELQPLFTVLAPLNEQIAAADGRIATLAATDPLVARLATAPAIGPVTASAVVATVDDIGRFRSAHQFEAYLGLVPGERSSGKSVASGPLRRRGTVACAGCWSKPPGACSGPSRPRRPRSGLGRTAWRGGAGRRLRSWPSRGGSRGSSTPCGGTECLMTPAGSAARGSRRR